VQSRGFVVARRQRRADTGIHASAEHDYRATAR
jgi:hypothetical protein